MDTLYVNWSSIFPLFARPLQPDSLRKALYPFFGEKRCFEKMRGTIYDYYRVNKNDFLSWQAPSHTWIRESDIAPCPITHAPFISDLGQICFNTKSVYGMTDAEARQLFAFAIGNSSAYWRNDRANHQDFSRVFNDVVFGYLPDLDDQRMNFLYFELRPPLRFRVYDPEWRFASAGKVFLHIYPSGHMSINLALSYDCKRIGPEISPDILIRRSAPWIRGNGLVVHSKLGKTTLNDLVKTVQNNISRSFFTNGRQLPQKLE